MDMFDKQQVLKKLPSPILHLLPEDAKEGDPLPEAKMGVDNAPPIIGAVFKRARRESVCSPPLSRPVFKHPSWCLLLKPGPSTLT